MLWQSVSWKINSSLSGCRYVYHLDVQVPSAPKLYIVSWQYLLGVTVSWPHSLPSDCMKRELQPGLPTRSQGQCIMYGRPFSFTFREQCMMLMNNITVIYYVNKQERAHFSQLCHGLKKCWHLYIKGSPATSGSLTSLWESDGRWCKLNLLGQAQVVAEEQCAVGPFPRMGQLFYWPIDKNKERKKTPQERSSVLFPNWTQSRMSHKQI